MKTKALQSIFSLRTFVRLSAAALMASAAGTYAQSDAARKELAPQQELIVNVEDLNGIANMDSESTRESLLENAFYDAAQDKEWLGKYKFRYNANIPKDKGGYLEFNLVDWERSVSNMYECTLSATYYTVAGETIKLGSFHATESGIAVSTRRDAGEQFQKAAESAFEQALEKLAEKTMGS